LSELIAYLHVLRKRKEMVVAIVAICAFAAFVLSLATTPQYQGSAKILITAKTRPGAGVDAAYQGALLSQQLVKSFAVMLESRPTAEAALDRHPEPTTPEELQWRIKAAPIPNTLLIQLTIDDTDANRAQRLTNNVALAFIDEAGKLEGGTAVQASLVEPALRPAKPLTPKTKLNILLGMAFGMLIAFGVALLAEHFDTSIKTTPELEKAINVPLLGTIPIFAKTEGALPIADSPRSIEAEAFRKLRTSLSFVNVDHQELCCVVTSPSIGDGKSTIVGNLAVAIAHAGKRVIVVEADLRRPMVHQVFGLRQQVGTTTVLLDHVEAITALQSVGEASIMVLTSGQLPPNPSELLNSRRMAELIQQLRNMADIVLIDSPPVLPVADPMVLTQWADGVLLVTRAGSTTRDQLQSARATCDRAGARILGTILNGVTRRSDNRSAHYGYYGSNSLGNQDPVAQPNTMRSRARSGDPMGYRVST
jgi:capsular exopolysaccharide synthesis family protein